jgi:hypothetical protein
MEIFLMLPKMTIHQLMLDDLFLYCLGWENWGRCTFWYLLDWRCMNSKDWGLSGIMVMVRMLSFRSVTQVNHVLRDASNNASKLIILNIFKALCLSDALRKFIQLQIY